MAPPDPVRCVLTWYPQIYLACHTDHKRARHSPVGLSPRDSSLLAHLNERDPITPAFLARHLRIGAPAMSAALKRLAARGYVSLDPDPADARKRHVRLSPSGARAMAQSSVLETTKVRALLRRLNERDRTRALDGLALLARAARELAEGRR